MASPIFEDLEISTDGFLNSREQAEIFKQEVFAKKDRLESVLDRKETVTKIEDTAKKDYNNPALPHKAQFKETYEPLISALYDQGEQIPLPVLHGLVESLAALARDLNNTLHDRAKAEYINEASSENDKKLAQIQHKRLRDAWDAYRKFAETIFPGLKLPEIKAKPGNFQSAVGTTVAFKFPDTEEPIYNPRAVARRLGIYAEGVYLTDVLDWLEENDPEQIKVKVIKVKL